LHQFFLQLVFLRKLFRLIVIMNQTENLYNILEIKKDATQNEIRIAYKKLALQWHPDKNEDKIFAENKFKKICEAYFVLSNPEQRRQYDIAISPPPPQPPRQRRPPPPPQDIPKETKKNSVQQQIVKVTLDELFTGCLKKFKIKSKIFINMNETTVKEKILEFDVKQGWKDGTKITFEQTGDQLHPTIPQNDIEFVIESLPHPIFQRNGDDLTYKAQITLKQALCGGYFELQHLDGVKRKIPLKGITTPNTTRTIQNEGMPISKSKTKERGNLHITFDVVFPEDIEPDVKQQLEKLL
jgi:DnaJ-class molecular chaperone